MNHNQDLTVQDAEIEEQRETFPSLAILSDLNTSNIEDRVKKAAKEMAKKIFESSVDGIDNMNQIVVATTSSIAKNKTEGMVFLYIIISEIASLDKSGDIGSVFLQKGIVKKIYQSFGNTIDDLYRDGKNSLQVYNSKAYLIDAFISDFFPLYSNGEIVIPSGGMTGELIYPDGFLNIFFRAVKKCFENDKIMVEEVLKHQAMLSNADAQNEKNRVMTIVDDIFNRETSRVLSLFNQSDKVRIMQYLQGKIDQFLKLSEKHSEEKNSAVGGETEALLKELHEKITHMAESGPSDKMDYSDQLKNIDKNVVVILEKQLMLLNRVEEMQNPDQDDFLSEAAASGEKGRTLFEEIDELKKQFDLLSKSVIGLPDELLQLIPTNRAQPQENTQHSPIHDDPYDLFSEESEEIVRDERKHDTTIHSIDYEQIGEIVKNVVQATLSQSLEPYLDKIKNLEQEVASFNEKLAAIEKVSTDTNKLLKEEIAATVEFIENSKQKD